MGSKTDFSGKKTPKLYDFFFFFICVHPPKGQRNSISTYHRIINKITSIQILFLSCVTFFPKFYYKITFLVATLSLYMQK
jgi:hypothetical protein